MSQVHLGHKIPWSDLIECCRLADPSTISLPIGECGFIHIDNKSTKLKIENRNYIKEQNICESKNCKTVGTQSFSKGRTQEINLYTKERKNTSAKIKKKYEYFSKKLVDAVFEFGDTQVNTPDLYSNQFLNQNLETYAEEFFEKINLDRYFNYQSRNNKIVMALLLDCELKNLLRFHESKEIDIVEAFATYYGGQAVGRGYIFLFEHHILPFYLMANAIIAADYQKDKSKWGLLNPESYFFSEILYDCDFLTFIPTLRHYLAEDVFMVDLEKTNQLLRDIFKYIYIYFYLRRKVCNFSYDDILSIFQDSIWYTFRLSKFDETECDDKPQ